MRLCVRTMSSGSILQMWLAEVLIWEAPQKHYAVRTLPCHCTPKVTFSGRPTFACLIIDHGALQEKRRLAMMMLRTTDTCPTYRVHLSHGVCQRAQGSRLIEIYEGRPSARARVSDASWWRSAAVRLWCRDAREKITRHFLSRSRSVIVPGAAQGTTASGVP